MENSFYAEKKKGNATNNGIIMWIKILFYWPKKKTKHMT
jgi:hypothetical protein